MTHDQARTAVNASLIGGSRDTYRDRGTSVPTFELRPPERVNLEGEDTGRATLSHTSIGTYLACHQKYNWAYEHRLTPAITATPLSMGRAFAHALEHADPDAGYRMLLDEAATERERAQGDPWLVAPNEQDVQVQAVTVREASRGYLARYGQHNQTREVTLRARVRNPVVGGRYSLTHDLVARVDALDTTAGEIIEDKLVTRIDRRILPARLQLDRQVTLSTYLVWRCLGIEINQVRYRLTRKPGIKQTKKESFEQYLDRIAEEYATRPDDYFHEETLTRSQDDFLRIEQECWSWVESIRASRRDGVWPRNVAHCSDYNGCPFLAACCREPGWQHQFVERPTREQVAA